MKNKEMWMKLTLYFSVEDHAQHINSTGNNGTHELN